MGGDQHAAEPARSGLDDRISGYAGRDGSSGCAALGRTNGQRAGCRVENWLRIVWLEQTVDLDKDIGGIG